MKIETVEQFMSLIDIDEYSWQDRNFARDFFSTLQKRQSVTHEVSELNAKINQLTEELSHKSEHARPHGYANRGHGYEYVYATTGIEYFIRKIAELPEMVELINTMYILSKKKKEQEELYK